LVKSLYFAFDPFFLPAKAKEASEEAMGAVTGGMGGFPGLM